MRQAAAHRRAPASPARWRRCAGRRSCSADSGSSAAPRRASQVPLSPTGVMSVKSACAFSTAERDHALPGARHAHDLRVVGVDDRGLAVREDARLRRRVGRQRGVAIHVIGRHVEHHARLEPERVRRVELEPGELEHVEIGADRDRAGRAPAGRDCRRRARARRRARPCGQQAWSRCSCRWCR